MAIAEPGVGHAEERMQALREDGYAVAARYNRSRCRH